MAGKRDRQQRILELIARNRIDSQDELADLLATEGVTTVQSTLSRDLRELGIVKGPAGYRVLGRGTPRPNVLRDLARRIRPLLRDWDTGGNLVVLRPARGSDPAEVARQVAEARAPEVVAALACDASILVVTRTAGQARELVRRLS